MPVKVINPDIMYLFIRKIMTISTGDSRTDLQVLIRSYANYMNMYASNLGQADVNVEKTYKEVKIKTKNFCKQLEDYGSKSN